MSLEAAVTLLDHHGEPIQSISRRPVSRVAGEQVVAHPFPEPRFPAGIGVPPAVLLVVLLVAAVSLSLLRPPGAGTETASGPDPAGWPGLVPGLTVAAVGLLAFVTLRALLVGPVRRLRDDLAAAISGSSRGGGHRVRRSSVREVDRIAVALRTHRSGTGDVTVASGLRVPLAVGLALVAVVLVGWLVISFVMVDRQSTTRAKLLLEESRVSTEGAAKDLRWALNEGWSGLQGATVPAVGVTGTDLRATVTAVLATRPVFRSVYAVDVAGQVVAVAGRDPQRPIAPPPAVGITQVNASGPAPAVVASAPMHDRAHTLVAEYDPRALNKVLRRSGAPTRVLDSGLRTVLSTGGYEAFTELDDPFLRAAATAALGNRPTATIDTVNNAASMVVAQRFGNDGDVTAALGWVVLHDQDLAAAGFVHNSLTRAAIVITSLSWGASLLVLAWFYISAILPLRRLGDHAEAIAAIRAGHPSPEPVAPQRLDEVGAIAAGLNRWLVTAIPAQGAAPPAPPRVTRSAPRLIPGQQPSPHPRLRLADAVTGSGPSPIAVPAARCTDTHSLVQTGN